MTEETIQLSKALTKRSRLFGRTSGKYKGQIVDKINNGGLSSNDDDLGVIRKKMFSLIPICFTVGKDAPRGHKSIQEFEKETRAHKDSLIQNMKNGFDLYEKILDANATKKIKVGDREMSVSAAIVYRDQVIPMYKDLREYLRLNLQSTLTRAELQDENAKESCETWLQGGMQGDKKTADPNRIEELRKTYLEGKLSKIHDPLDLRKWIDELNSMIEQEEGDLQTGLYNNNVSTTITWTPTE
jgi:hypothetical protein